MRGDRTFWTFQKANGTPSWKDFILSNNSRWQSLTVEMLELHCCSFRRYGFDSQHPQDGSKQSITSVLGNPALINDRWYTYKHTWKTCVPSLSLYLELIKMRLSFIWTAKQPSGEPSVRESYIRQYKGHLSMQVSTMAPLVTAYF